MLALKTLASTDAPGKTLIFDEVDAGIGGAVADVVGGRLQRLAERFQVLCITHLPQIAAHGATHFQHQQVACAQGRTLTSVTRLGATEREEEVARMIAGERRHASRSGQRRGDAEGPPGGGERRIQIERRKRKTPREKGIEGGATRSHVPEVPSSKRTAAR